MLIRQLIVAALAAGAAVAHADVIPAAGSAGTAPQSGIFAGWTGANGTDVMSSGVLSGNLSLIGGLSYGDASKASGNQGSATLADVLYGKASANIGQSADGQTKLFYQQGIEGMYLLGSGHGILAAMLGAGVSVVGSGDGVVVSNGISAPHAGGMLGSSGGSVGAMPSSGKPTGGSVGSSAGGGASGTTGGAPGAIVDHSGGVVSVILPGPAQLPPVGDGFPPGAGGVGGGAGGGGLGQGQGQLPPPVTAGTDVPEPSSIALMLAGLLGAGSVVRRRKR
jgi:hypothetical protein